MAKYYTDGSSTIGIKSAYCVTDEKGKVIELVNTKNEVDETQERIIKISEFTNNEGEYRGVIAALKLCKEGDEVLTDSQLVVNQINGLFKAKAKHLLAYKNEAKELADNKQVLIRWIPRNENLAGQVFEK
jgi:ribonuclease HI